MLFDQLVYTSFARVGFKVLASTGVPAEIQQAFIQQVVYQHWNSYKPLGSGYRATYIHQVTLEHNLFGWLYNDGVDDLGRSNVPYFVCYYLAEALHAVQLENIFTCLQKGPIALIERQSLPGSLETVVVSDLWSYESARIGVAIPFSVRQSSYIKLQQRQLLDIFISIDEKEQSKKQQSDSVQPSVIATPIPQASAEMQETIPVLHAHRSEAQINSLANNASISTSPNKSTLLIGIGVGFASSLALIGIVYGILQWQYSQNSHLLKPAIGVKAKISNLKPQMEADGRR